MQKTQLTSGELLTRQEVMDRLGVRSASTIWNWTADLGFPKPIQITKRSLVFRWDDIVKWLDARERAGSSASGDTK